jgi:methyl-CpG-binding domain protein 4
LSISTDDPNSALRTAREPSKSTKASSINDNDSIVQAINTCEHEAEFGTFVPRVGQNIEEMDSRNVCCKETPLISTGNPHFDEFATSISSKDIARLRQETANIELALSIPLTLKLKDEKNTTEVQDTLLQFQPINQPTKAAKVKKPKLPTKSPFFLIPVTLEKSKKRKRSTAKAKEVVKVGADKEEYDPDTYVERKSTTKEKRKHVKIGDNRTDSKGDLEFEGALCIDAKLKTRRKRAAKPDEPPKFETIEEEIFVTTPPVEVGQHAKAITRSVSKLDIVSDQESGETNNLGAFCGEENHGSPDKKTKRPKFATKSPFFPTIKPEDERKRKPGLKGRSISCIPFPPLSAPQFGLIQEKLAFSPYELLLAVTFLIRTKGRDAIPIFFQLIDRYPTKEDLAAADLKDIIPMIHHLGLQVQRANSYIKYAKMFINDPPVKGRRHRVENYPTKGAHKGIAKGEIIDDVDDRTGAWEIAHMTKGHYAIDSWRMFCRDILRGEAQGYNGEGRDSTFEPEWKRVIPLDKELRAWKRWSWLKEGREYDVVTGETRPASKAVLKAAAEGRIAWDDRGGMSILDVNGDEEVNQVVEEGVELVQTTKEFSNTQEGHGGTEDLENMVELYLDNIVES